MHIPSEQAVNLMDCPEFRDLLLYVSQGLLDDCDIPHRTKITEVIGQRFKEEYVKMVERLQVHFH